MLACEENGLTTVGAGLDIKQEKTHIQDINVTKVAIIALAEYEFNQSESGGAGSAPIDPIDNYQQVKQAQKEAEIVIVTQLGGNDSFPYPESGLRKLSQHFIGFGGQAVICHHPHIPGAYEYYQGKPIVYSLGNFIFDHAPPKGCEAGYMAQSNFYNETRGLTSL